MKPDAEASLHIGLGIGMTAKAFAEHGLRTDVIELHPEVGHQLGLIGLDNGYKSGFGFSSAKHSMRTGAIERTGAGAGGGVV